MEEYEKLLKASGKFRIELGLERISQILEIFANPQNSMDFIHVAGTNGKGSVCSIIEAILLEAGVRVGKYTSPHLFDYTERISVCGINIPKGEFSELVNLVVKKDEEKKIGLTEFEILTCVSFLYFKKCGVKIAILETGLGGRFDATNIIKKPLVSIITSISFDHKERLGNTIEKIAFEKAGIIKQNSPSVFLEENAGYITLIEYAKKINSNHFSEPLNIKIDNNIANINGTFCPISLNGDFQAENLKLALLGLMGAGLFSFLEEKHTLINFDMIKNALKKLKWKFRMEKINYKGCNLLIDGCHNPDGARVLAEYLEKYQNNKKTKFIFGCLSNKDFKGILDNLYKKEFDFCFYEFNYPNALKYNDLDLYKEKLRQIYNPFDEILKNDYDLCIVAGSLYMLGEIFKNKL